MRSTGGGLEWRVECSQGCIAVAAAGTGAGDPAGWQDGLAGRELGLVEEEQRLAGGAHKWLVLRRQTPRQLQGQGRSVW